MDPKTLEAVAHKRVATAAFLQVTVAFDRLSALPAPVVDALVALVNERGKISNTNPYGPLFEAIAKFMLDMKALRPEITSTHKNPLVDTNITIYG